MTYFQKNTQNDPTPDTKPTIQSFQKKVTRTRTKRVKTSNSEISSKKVLACTDCEYTCDKTHTLYMHKQRKHRQVDKTDNGIYEKLDLPQHVNLNGLSSSLQNELAGLFQCDEDWDDNLSKETLKECSSDLVNDMKITPGNGFLENASEELQSVKKDISENKAGKTDASTGSVPDVDRVKEEEDENIVDNKRFDDAEVTKLLQVIDNGLEEVNEGMKSIEEVPANEQERQVLDVKFEEDECLDVTDVKSENQPLIIHVDDKEHANVQIRQESDELEEENEDVIFVSQIDGPKPQSVQEEEDFLEQKDINDAVDMIFNSDNQDETTVTKDTPPKKKPKLEYLSKSKNSFIIGAEKEISKPNIAVDKDNHENIVAETNREKEPKSETCKRKRVMELMKKLGKQALEMKAKGSLETYSSEKVKSINKLVKKGPDKKPRRYKSIERTIAYRMFHLKPIPPPVVHADYEAFDEEMLDEMINEKIHKNESLYTCTVCGKTTSGKSLGKRQNLRDHVEARHVVGVSHNCQICGAEAKTRNSQRMHMRSYHKEKTPKI